jgi:hypothetical protein
VIVTLPVATIDAMSQSSNISRSLRATMNQCGEIVDDRRTECIPCM